MEAGFHSVTHKSTVNLYPQKTAPIGQTLGDA